MKPRVNSPVATPAGEGTLIDIRPNTLTGNLEAVVRFRLSTAVFDYLRVGVL